MYSEHNNVDDYLLNVEELIYIIINFKFTFIFKFIVLRNVLIYRCKLIYRIIYY